MEKDVEIYQKLKKLRKERGLTLANLADRIGSDYQQLSRIERGKSRLTVDTLVKMAEAFDTPIDELFENKKLLRQESKNEKIDVDRRCISEDTLGVILEKLETVLDETQAILAPQVKASLASQIYRESLQSPHVVDFAVNIIRAVLASK